MNEYETFNEIVNSSKQFKMHGSILTLIGYYTGKRIDIDLNKIDAETFEKIIYTDADADADD